MQLVNFYSQAHPFSFPIRRPEEMVSRKWRPIRWETSCRAAASLGVSGTGDISVSAQIRRSSRRFPYKRFLRHPWSLSINNGRQSCRNEPETCSLHNVESGGACQHSTDGSDPARIKWLVEENSKGTRWEWVAERSSLLGCENGHLHWGGPAPHFSPASTTERLTGRQCTVKQDNAGRRRGQSAKQSSLTKSTSAPPCGLFHHPPLPPTSTMVCPQYCL